jgi:hypothetical protein
MKALDQGARSTTKLTEGAQRKEAQNKFLADGADGTSRG